MSLSPGSRVAVVGAGAAGLMSAWLLQDDHDVTVYEAGGRPGGHVHTVHMHTESGPTPVEIGAEFFFEEGYSGLLAMIDRFGIPRRRRPLATSLTFQNGGRPFQLPPRSAFAIKRCLRPSILRKLMWLGALAAAGEVIVRRERRDITVRQLLQRMRAPADITEDLIIPMVASSWGITRRQASEISAYGVVRVMGLRLKHLPHGVAVEGGFDQYIHALVADLPQETVRLNTPVEAVYRDGDTVQVQAAGQRERFDAVILACDWHNSAAMCRKEPAFEEWHRVFSSFEDYPARCALHRDVGRMPADRRLWASANFFFSDEEPRTTVWSGFDAKQDLFRSWLGEDETPPESTEHIATYRHILTTPSHFIRQKHLRRLQGTAGLWAVGMYTDGVDNHESALRSAQNVCAQIAPQARRVEWFGDRVSS